MLKCFVLVFGGWESRYVTTCFNEVNVCSFLVLVIQLEDIELHIKLFYRITFCSYMYSCFTGLPSTDEFTRCT